jgi:Ser/Thr protein kinase RdoA (MazF antagonist)
LGIVFTSDFRWPKCYHAEINNDETKLWLEYIEGVSASDLTTEMYENIAKALGRFHGKFEKCIPQIDNLCSADSMKNYYHYNRSKKELFNYIRQSDCKIPTHLCKMIIEMDNKSDRVWAKIEKLPIVLRHGDFFPPNIFYDNGKVVLIDWDSAGLSYPGEDLVSLITDGENVDKMVEYYRKCVPAYLKGFNEITDASQLENAYIYERIIMHNSYRLIDNVNWRNQPKTHDEIKFDLDVLQKIYEMGN